jgi:hypothetical protein
MTAPRETLVALVAVISAILAYFGLLPGGQ